MPGQELMDRIQPNNLDAERAVLGAVILDKGALPTAVEMLEPEDFYDPRHSMVFDLIKGMARKDKAVDEITFEEEMTRQNLWERVGGSSFTATLIDAVSTSANIEHYCAIVREKSIFRALIRAGAEITRSGYAEDGDSSEALIEAEQKVFEIARRGAKSSIKNIKDVVTGVFNKIERDIREETPTNAVLSGFPDLDSLTGGFQPGSLNIIAARPSVGKTAFALNIASHAAIYEGVPTLIFSLEMSGDQIATRMLSSLARVNIRELVKRRNLDNALWTDMTSAASELCNSSIFIDDSSMLSTFELRSRCLRFMSRHIGKRCLVVIDYLQLMTSGNKRGENRNQEVADISRMLKGIARECDIPVIALSQLSRKVEERGAEKRPMLSDLRDSGAIEQDADVVAFLYRKSYQDLDSGDNTAELLVEKHRNGPTGKVNLVFYREYARFESSANFKM
ncbi:MAG: replicative DNA helicase [Synergistaceae bacterium]|nr:replicative DNA helicase [Synergistaceae bacterium]